MGVTLVRVGMGMGMGMGMGVGVGVGVIMGGMSVAMIAGRADFCASSFAS